MKNFWRKFEEILTGIPAELVPCPVIPNMTMHRIMRTSSRVKSRMTCAI